MKLRPEAKDYLNKVLYFLANSDRVPHEQLALAEKLLQTGAEPNYIHDTETLSGYQSILGAAASTAKHFLIELLFKYGAKADLFIPRKAWDDLDDNVDIAKAREEERIQTMTEKQKMQEMVKRKKLPLSIAMKDYKERFRSGDLDGAAAKSCSLLSKKTILDSGTEVSLLNVLKRQYKNIYAHILKNLTEAKHNGQQFICIVLESHTSVPSLVVELMVLLISKRLGINTILTEHNKYMESCVSRGYMPTREREWCVSLTIRKKINALKMQSIPVDLGHWGAKKIGEHFDDYENLTTPSKDFDDTSIEGITYRNTVMRDVTEGGIKENSSLFVGAAHGYGLLEEARFPDSVLLLTINAENKTLQIEIRENSDVKPYQEYALQSPNILQAETDLDEYCELLSPEVAVEYVDRVHQEIHYEICFFKEDYNPTTVFEMKETFEPVKDESAKKLGREVMF